MTSWYLLIYDYHISSTYNNKKKKQPTCVLMTEIKLFGSEKSREKGKTNGEENWF